MTQTRSGAISPCVSLCKLDDEDFCLGCMRSADEIARWREMSVEEKQAVMAVLPGRRLTREVDKL